MKLESKLLSENQVEEQDISLPKAFLKTKMQDVIASLLRDGYDIFDVSVGGEQVNLARLDAHEVYFNNEEAVCTYTDYGRVMEKAYPISVNGTFESGVSPSHLWLKGVEKRWSAA